MAHSTSVKSSVDSSELRDKWLTRLTDLVKLVDGWAKELDWSTRVIQIPMEDSEVGAYKAPALLLQQEAVRMLLETIERTALGADGVVDLYLMPAYDDIASLYFVDGEWQLRYIFPDQPTVATIRDAESKPLSKETLSAALDSMRANGV